MMTIARMTWIEILRKRVFIVTVLMTVAFLGLYALGVHAVARSIVQPVGQPLNLLDTYLHGMLWLALGLYTSNFTVAYLSIFSSVGTISAEIENGLLLAILPRPLGRWQVYLGKWIGYALWSVLYGAVMFWAVVFIAHGFIHFPMVGESLWRAFGVFELIPLTLVALSVLGSIYLPTLGNGVAITLLFGLGMIGGFVQRLSSGPGSVALNKIGLMTSLIIPTNAAYYRMVFELMGGSSISVAGSQVNSTLGPFAGGAVPSNAFLVYAVVYIVACIGIGVWRFQGKDI